MEPFTMEIAGTAMQIHSRFGSTKEYFRRYLTDDLPELTISASAEDTQKEQQLLNEEADREHLRRRVFTDPFLERSVIQRKAARYLLSKDILLLHGSTVVVDGNAYLFTAGCGVGKSTHTRLWMQRFGNRAMMLNDDRAFLSIQNTVTAYGSPWSGKHGIDSNIHAPLAGICILERGTENKIHPLAAAAALPFLLTQSFLPDEASQEAVTMLTQRLAASVPLWKLQCTKEPTAVDAAYSAMAQPAASGIFSL